MEKLIFTKSIIKDGLKNNEITRKLAQRYREGLSLPANMLLEKVVPLGLQRGE
jgi:hypothetical protein